MCFGEQDFVNLKLHFAARRRYPGIGYHEPTLERVAREHGLITEAQVKALTSADLDEVALELVRTLPAGYQPRMSREAVA